MLKQKRQLWLRNDESQLAQVIIGIEKYIPYNSINARNNIRQCNIHVDKNNILVQIHLLMIMWL